MGIYLLKMAAAFAMLQILPVHAHDGQDDLPTATVAQIDSAEWEADLVKSWQGIGDCQPSTGMCDKCGFGMAVVDLNGPDGIDTRFYNAGPGDREAPWGPDNHWEIASITKPFTAIAMLVLEDDGVLSRTSTIGEFLPCDWEQANSDVASITLLEMVYHTSGLPSQPPDRGPSIGGNPFANYTQDRLCASLLKLNSLPTRGRYMYSNYAYGALGYVLTMAVDPINPPDYEDIIKEIILNPLEMYDTSVTYDKAGWDKAAVGCARGINRGKETIRLGAYDTLQGNGALRSTLRDMATFLRFKLYIDAGSPMPRDTTLFGPGHPPSKALDKLTLVLTKANNPEESGNELACSCVSGWCEGYLCPHKPLKPLEILPTGLEMYTSGGVVASKKSGDTGGYSSRVAWSFAKGRGVVAADTCGGCGSVGTAGSGPQRAVQLLVDGPPVLYPTNQDSSSVPGERLYVGKYESHNFPSSAVLDVKVFPLDASTIEIAVSSSDGAGSTSVATSAGDGVWLIHEPLLFGTGWGDTSDPFNDIKQQRTLIISPDGATATFQDMGEDITKLSLVIGDAHDTKRKEPYIRSKKGLKEASQSDLTEQHKSFTKWK